MLKKFHSAAICLALLPLATTAVAQSKPATGAAPAKQTVNIEEGIDKMFAGLDKDKNKQLSYEEFKNGVVAERQQMIIIDRLRTNFKTVDKNADGTLDAAEFNALPGLKSVPEPKPTFAEYDINKDKKMDFREYVGFVSKMSSRPPPKK